jgi:PPOX class probable F420-dependent enzyme
MIATGGAFVSRQGRKVRRFSFRMPSAPSPKRSARKTAVARRHGEPPPLAPKLRLMRLPETARELIESGAIAHLVTIARDGSPQVSCVWIGFDGDELVSGHLGERQKLRNVRRDPRVAVSFEGTRLHPPGLKEYLVIHGRARITEGGAPELLQRLAYVYLGPDVKFPPMDDPPPGVTLRISPERIGGVGPWTA